MKKFVHPLVLSLLPAAPAFAGPGLPPGWFGSGADQAHYEAGTGLTDGANGEAAYIRALPDAAANNFFGLDQCVDAREYSGIRLRFSARMKTINANSGQLFMRVSQKNMTMTFDNMDNRRVTGTTDWQRKEIVLNVPTQATQICYGAFLAGGKGEMWIDDIKLEQVSFNVPVTTSIGGAFAGHGGMGRFDGR